MNLRCLTWLSRKKQIPQLHKIRIKMLIILVFNEFSMLSKIHNTQIYPDSEYHDFGTSLFFNLVTTLFFS